jgi:hypothetical protein
MTIAGVMKVATKKNDVRALSVRTPVGGLTVMVPVALTPGGGVSKL